VSGGRALAGRWSRALASRDTANGTANEDRSATPEDLVRAARSGDATAQEILDIAATAVSTVLGSVLAQLGFSTVVVGGGVAPAFEVMRPSVELALRDRRRLIGPVTILAAALGPYAGAMGAALNATAQPLAVASTLPQLSAI
jgi:glucokinase